MKNRSPLALKNSLFNFREMKDSQLSIALNLPALLVILGFVGYPLGFAFYISLRKVGMLELRTGEMPFIGFGNFMELINDNLFWLSLNNTFRFTFWAVLLQVILGFGLALLLFNAKGRLPMVIKFLMLVPWAVPPIANAALWRFIFDTKYGFFNALLYNLGIIDNFQSFLGDSTIALYCVVLAHVWRTTPFAVLLLYAALQGLPQEIYEAAMVDGASMFHMFSKITFPLMIPTLVLTMIFRTTWAFQLFDEVMGITLGGPGYSTWVASYYSYRYAFSPPLDMGVGAASAFVLALITGIFIFFYVRISQKYKVGW